MSDADAVVCGILIGLVVVITAWRIHVMRLRMRVFRMLRDLEARTAERVANDTPPSESARESV
ncbi:MAG: hypothetical protein QM811_23370 [Pirellulales bacterium]